MFVEDFGVGEILVFRKNGPQVLCGPFGKGVHVHVGGGSVGDGFLTA